MEFEKERVEELRRDAKAIWMKQFTDEMEEMYEDGFGEIIKMMIDTAEENMKLKEVIKQLKQEIKELKSA